MNDFKQTEDWIRGSKPKIATSSDMGRRILSDAQTAMASSPGRSRESGLPTRRLIVRTTFRFTAAAAILIAAILSLTLFDGTVAPAYAVEQTIEAMRHVTTVHYFATDWQDREMETWIKVNPETGENDCHYVNERDQISISTPRITYFYDPKANVVRVVEGGALRSDLRFGRFIEDVLDKMIRPQHGEVQFTNESDPDTGEEVILLWAKSSTTEMEVMIDPETKLPIRIDFSKAVPGQIVRSIDRIFYNEPLPEGLFDYAIPQDAQVIRVADAVNNPEYGMPVEGMTRDEARVQIIGRFWRYVIEGSFEDAHRLLPIVSAGQIENTLGSFGGVAELVSVGEPLQEPDTHDEVVTPVRVRFSNGNVWEIYQITQFRLIDGKLSCVLVGEEQGAKAVE